MEVWALGTVEEEPLGRGSLRGEKLGDLGEARRKVLEMMCSPRG